MENNPSPDPLVPVATNVPTGNGGGTVVKPALTLEEINATLGSTFKDSDSALKALKDTQSYVGKRKEDIVNEVKATIAPPADVASKADVQALHNELFYSQNPQYKPYESMISKLGADPAAVVQLPEVKDVLDKAQKADQVAGTQSVIQSNQRLAQPAEPVIEQMVKVANARGTTNEDVAMIAAEAINKQNQES